MYMFTALIFVVTVAIASSYTPYWRSNYNYRKSIFESIPSNVKELTIDNSSIPLTAETFHRFTDLERLNIKFIKDPQISRDMLKYLKHLEVLNIYKTDLDYVDDRMFMYAPHLKVVLLDKNKLTYLAPDTFGYLPVLEEVHLEDNQLNSLSPQLFEGTSLKRVYLEGNPWHCDCEMAKSMQWLEDHNVKIMDLPLCAYPPDMERLVLVAVHLKNVCKGRPYLLNNEELV